MTADTFDMKYDEIDITRVRGDTFPFTLTVKDSAGAVVDISGFTIVLTVNTEEEPTDETNQVFQLAGVIPVGTDGVVQFTLSTANADQTPSEYYYDCQQTDGAAKLRTLAKGKWTVVQDVTKT